MQHMTATSVQVTPETDVLKFNLQLFAEEGFMSGDTADDNIDDSASDDDGNVNDTDDAGSNAQDGDSKSDEKPAEGAPGEYKDFTVPEGLTYDKESATDFLAAAKELNLTQDQAQKFVDLYGTRMLGQQEAQQKQSETWAAESKKQFKKADIELANKALGKFADKEMIDLLATSGFGNHPKMIGLFKAIGSQMSEGQFVDSGSSVSPKTAAEILYPSQGK